MPERARASIVNVAGGAFLCLALLLARPAAAQDGASDEPRRRHGFISLQVENDMFGDGADRHYTHGMEVSYVSEPCAHRWVEDLAKALRVLPRQESDCGRNRVGFSLGQAIFTPSDISRVPPDALDRPYAGWLYLSASLVVEGGRPVPARPHGLINRALQKLELNVGVVGPASFADDVQTGFHAFIGAREPKGWSYQIKDEPTLLLSYEVQRRLGYQLGRHLEVDVTPHLGLSLGNVFTHAAVGVTVRVGNHMVYDYGPPSIRPRFPGAAFFDTEHRFGWYFFAGVEGRAVARNIFLDGNSFRDSPSVNKHVFVGDLQAGLALTLLNARLSFTSVYRTHEFKTQAQNDAFGAITLSVRF